jgi:uncharacterized membrane protein YgcG
VTVEPLAELRPHGPLPRLSDQAERLRPGERAVIERRLEDAAVALGRPVLVRLVPRLGRAGAADLAAATFNDATAGGGAAPSPVVLVVSFAERAAAIETGDKVAGIVPEVDARRIASALGARIAHQPAAALDEAISAIVRSAAETAARRRPAPVEQEPEPRAVPAAGPEEQHSEPSDGTGAGARVPPAPRRSRLPLAAAVALLVVLGLAFRRRRRIARERADEQARDPTGPTPTRAPGGRSSPRNPRQVPDPTGGHGPGALFRRTKK